MAFNKAPTQSTYQTRDVKLMFPPTSRNKTVNTDNIALNGFFDVVVDRGTETKSFTFTKRDGTAAFAYTIPSANIRGMHYWEDQDKVYVAYDDKIAIIDGSSGVLSTTVTPFLTTAGDVGFTQFYYDTGTTKIVAGDGSRLITIDSANTVVTGSDADMPTSFNPHTVFLDGYLFMIKSGTSDIYNSNLNDPLLYTAGDFITAEMQSDNLLRILLLNNYILAMGSSSIEYFFDAANASGSPLQRNDTFVKSIGFLNGVAHYGSQIFFVGQTSTTDPDVYMLQDAKIDQLNAPALRRYLQPNTVFLGAIISNGGHDFYCLTAVSGSTVLETFWYDLETKVWTRAAYKQQIGFPIKWAITLPITGTGNTSLCVLDGSASLVYFSPTVYQDTGDSFTAILQTEPETFDTQHEKYMSRLIVAADRPPSNATAEISWSDDDFQSFSSPRSVQLNQEFPALQRGGRFRKRAFKVSVTANVPFRTTHLEIDFNIGGR